MLYEIMRCYKYFCELFTLIYALEAVYTCIFCLPKVRNMYIVNMSTFYVQCIFCHVLQRIVLLSFLSFTNSKHRKLPHTRMLCNHYHSIMCLCMPDTLEDIFCFLQYNAPNPPTCLLRYTLIEQ